MLKLSPGYILRSVLDMHVIVGVGAANYKQSHILSLSDSGALLWRAMEKGATEAELAERLCAEYDVSPEIAKQDIARFLEQLRSKNLIYEE